MTQRHHGTIEMEQIDYLHGATLLKGFQIQALRLVVNLDLYWVDLHIFWNQEPGTNRISAFSQSEHHHMD